MSEKYSFLERSLYAANLSLHKLRTEAQNSRNRAYHSEIRAGVTESFLEYIQADIKTAGLDHPDAYIVLNEDTDSGDEEHEKIDTCLFLPFQHALYTFRSPHNRLNPDQQLFLPGTATFDGISERLAFMQANHATDTTGILTHQDKAVSITVEPLGTGQGRLSPSQTETLHQIIRDKALEQGVSTDFEFNLSRLNTYYHALDTYDEELIADSIKTSAWMKEETKRAISLLKAGGHADILKDPYKDVRLSEYTKRSLFTPDNLESNIRLELQTGELQVVPYNTKSKQEQVYPISSPLHIALMPIVADLLMLQVPHRLRLPQTT